MYRILSLIDKMKELSKGFCKIFTVIKIDNELVHLIE